MTDISEYGDIMPNAYIDEWGRRRINSLLEEGTKIIIAIGIILKQWSQKGYTTHVYIRHKTFRLTQTLKTFGQWMLPVPVIFKYWTTTLQVAHIYGCPMKVIQLSPALLLSHLFSRRSRLLAFFERLELLHEFYAGKPSAKKTKLFLVLGDLAIQLSND